MEASVSGNLVRSAVPMTTVKALSLRKRLRLIGCGIKEVIAEVSLSLADHTRRSDNVQIQGSNNVRTLSPFDECIFTDSGLWKLAAGA